LGGQLMDIGIHTEMLTFYTVTSVSENEIGLDFMFTSIKMNMDSGDYQFGFSSETDAEFASEADLGPMLRAMTNLPFHMTMDKQGNVKSVSGIEKMMVAMKESIHDEIDEFTKEQMVGQFGQQFNEESMQSNLGQWFAIFPTKEVRIGESWNTNQTISTGQVNMHANIETTLRRVHNNVAELSVEANFETDAPIIQSNGGMETAISISGSQKGKMEVDKTTGWVIKGELKQEIETKIDIFGMTLPQTITTRIHFEKR